MEHVDPTAASPFPLDGGRVGVGGARTGLAEGGAKGFDDASRALLGGDSASTPSQPSPIEGEGSRFGRDDRVPIKAIRRARKMRAEPTWTETKLWERLRTLPIRFRRQAPVGPYFADFICHRAALVVEVDGGVHERTDVALRDLARDAWFETQGYLTLRVSTKDVETNLDGVVARIRILASNRLGKVI